MTRSPKIGLFQNFHWPSSVFYEILVQNSPFKAQPNRTSSLNKWSGNKDCLFFSQNQKRVFPNPLLRVVAQSIVTGEKPNMCKSRRKPKNRPKETRPRQKKSISRHSKMSQKKSAVVFAKPCISNSPEKSVTSYTATSQPTPPSTSAQNTS